MPSVFVCSFVCVAVSVNTVCGSMYKPELEGVESFFEKKQNNAISSLKW